MSTRLTKALEFANYRVTLNNQQAQLKAKTQSLLSYSINGGTFTIDIPLITFCKQLIDVAVDSCCDAVKFQKRDIDLVYTQEMLTHQYKHR